MDTITAVERIFITGDRTKAVREGAPDAAFLLAGIGGTISAADAEKYRIGADGKLGPPDAIENRRTRVIKPTRKRARC